MAGGEAGGRGKKAAAEAGGGGAPRRTRKRTPRKNARGEQGNAGGGKARKGGAEDEAPAGGKASGAADAPSGTKGKRASRPARESPSRQNGGEEETPARPEPGSVSEKAERTDSKSKRTPRKRIVRNSSSGNPGSGTPGSSPAKTPTSTPPKHGTSGGGSGGGAGGRKSPTPGSGVGEGRREVVKIHFPTAQERQAGGSPKLDASKFVEVEESPPTTPPAAASMRNAAEAPRPQAQQHQHQQHQSTRSAVENGSTEGRGPRAATMVTVGSHGTSMADVAVQPLKANVPESGATAGTMRDKESPGDSPPRSLIRKMSQVNISASAGDNPRGHKGWTPPSPHSRKSLGDALLMGSGSEGEEDETNTGAIATPVVTTFPSRAPVPSSHEDQGTGAGAADAASNPESAESTGLQIHAQGASGVQLPPAQRGAPMHTAMYPDYGYGGPRAYAQYPPGGWYPQPAPGGMPQMSPEQAMAAAYGLYGMPPPPQMQQMQMAPQQGQQGQQMGGQQMPQNFGAPPAEWYAGQWPMGVMPPGMPGIGQPWPVGPDGYPMVMPPPPQHLQQPPSHHHQQQQDPNQQHQHQPHQHRQREEGGEEKETQNEAEATAESLTHSATAGGEAVESPELKQSQPEEQQQPEQNTRTRRPAYVRPSDRGKPGFQQEQEHKLLAYAAGGDEQARALALKVAQEEEEVAAKQAAAASRSNPTEDGSEYPEERVLATGEHEQKVRTEHTANVERSSSKSKRRGKRRNKKGGDGTGSGPTNARGGEAARHGSTSTTVSAGADETGRNVAVSSVPTNDDDDDIGGLEYASNRQTNRRDAFSTSQGGNSRTGGGIHVRAHINDDDDDIGGLEYASTQRRLYGGPRQVRGAVYASDVEQSVSHLSSGKKQLGERHGQRDGAQDTTTPQVAQLFAHAAATGAWGKPS